ncbi:MAG: VWA domain-containing protein, partial [Acidobacteria bacterium]|nr:VWA domain-containing protein [Acidobacteriota bacterium]
VLEDGVPQSIATFEQVIVAPAGPQATRREPNTIEAARQLAANPRNRVFVLFLDVPHVTVDGAWHSREPLIRLIDNTLGDDDLVGIMTPAMSAADVVLARKTDVLAAGLRDRWPWGERHTLQRTAREQEYEACYPWEQTRGVVEEMVARRRERTTLDAMQELVHYLSGIREERKAIVTVTEGWLLYRPNSDLTRLRIIDPRTETYEPVPGKPEIGVGPDGRMRMGADPTRGPTQRSRQECDRDRLALSALNNFDHLRRIIDDANRWNTSFYTIDPRGLPVFDAPIGPAAPPPPHIDAANLRNRHETMRMLAENTDGLSVMNNNDLDAGLKRISDDLTSYYLLGYYSTNTKYDGRFRAIDVKVTRPGVQVRARRGYRAATEEEVRTARAVAAPAVPEPIAAVQAAIAGLARLRSDTSFRVHAAPSAGEAGSVSTIWVAGELRPGGPAGATSSSQATAEIQVTGGAAGTARVPLAAGQRAFLAPVTLDQPVSSGHLDVRVRLQGAGMAQTSVVRLAVGPAAALLFRRGPSTGNRMQPAGDVQFSRTERARLEIPLAGGDMSAAGRVLDRNGQTLTVPVTVGHRTDDETGQRWLTADVTLAALGAGDYAIEVLMGPAEAQQRVLTAIRVTR